MKKRTRFQRFLALALALAMVCGNLPALGRAADVTAKESDPVTLGRMEGVYGSNTSNAGKVTVDKSISKDSLTANGHTFTASDDENFIVAISQYAQIMALASEMKTPVDVVFVLDTSGSMSATVMDANGNSTGKNRSQMVIELVNETISDLMAANEHNRVGVVAFSAYNTQAGTAGGDAANVLSGLNHYTEGDQLDFAGHIINVIHTPGHSPGSVVLHCEDVLFTGDTLFAGSCGRTDLPGGDQNVLFASLLRLAAIEDDYTVYPGHSGSTLLSREKQYNPFIKRAKAAAEQEA